MFNYNTQVYLLGDPILDYWDDFETDQVYVFEGGALNLEYNLLKLIDDLIMDGKIFFKSAYCLPNINNTQFDVCDKELFHAKTYALCEDDDGVNLRWRGENNPNHNKDSEQVLVSPYWFTPLTSDNKCLIISNYNKKFVERNWNLIKDNRYEFIIVDSKYDLPNINDLKELSDIVIIRQSSEDNKLKSLNFNPSYFITTNSKKGTIDVINNNQLYQTKFDIIESSNPDELISDIGAGDVFTAALSAYLIRNISKQISVDTIFDAIKYAIDITSKAITNSKYTCRI